MVRKTDDNFKDLSEVYAKIDNVYSRLCDKAVGHTVEPDIDKLMQRAKELSDDIKNRHPKVLVMQIILKHVSAHSIYRNTNGSQDDNDILYNHREW